MKKLMVLLVVCVTSTMLAQQANNAGTPEDRKALFDDIIQKTKIREAWSSIKNEKLNFDPMAAMMALEDEVVQADTDEKLFYAIQKMSAARRDRHLSVKTVPNGLLLPESDGLTAPIRFFPDYGNKKDVFLFVSDLGKSIGKHIDKKPSIGDELLEINGELTKNYLERVKAYTRHSTNENFLIRAAYALSSKDQKLPPWFYQDEFTLKLKPKKGKAYTITLPYLENVEWTYGRVFHDYPGYKEVHDHQYESFKVYEPIATDNQTLVLWWYGFRGDLPEAIDALIHWADANDKLHYNLIIDAVDSRGGSQGAYALARLSPKAFKTTGGNLKLSDITYDFVVNYTQRYLKKQALMDHDSRETEDDGTWAVEWLNGPVLKGLARGQDYSNNTPFKCAHLPYYSDWTMKPAKKHFKGKMVVLFGPWGGSHLTQFAAMINDNDLGYTMGMPDGGYSNTWEWTEVLTFPISGKPVVSFMWNIGHTIRPNGEIAEGNPSMVDAYIPVTRDNYLTYKKLLVNKAQTYLNK